MKDDENEEEADFNDMLEKRQHEGRHENVVSQKN